MLRRLIFITLTLALLHPAEAVAKYHTWNVHSVKVPQTFIFSQSYFEMAVAGDHVGTIVPFETILAPATLSGRTVTFDGTKTVIRWSGSFPNGVSPVFGYQLPTGCFDYPPCSYGWGGSAIASMPDVDILEPAMLSARFRLANTSPDTVHIGAIGTLAFADSLRARVFNPDSLPPGTFTFDPGAPFVLAPGEAIERDLPAVDKDVVIYAEIGYAGAAYTGTVQAWSQKFEVPGCDVAVPGLPPLLQAAAALLLVAAGALAVRRRIDARAAPRA